MKLMRYWLILVGMYHLIACAPDHDGAELLSVPVKNTRPIEGEHRQYYQDQLGQFEGREIWPTVASIWGAQFSKTQQSVVFIKERTDPDHTIFDVIMIFDDVPDGDSTSGYYFNATIKDTDQGYELIKLEVSFRCWPGEGRRYFSVEPCY